MKHGKFLTALVCGLVLLFGALAACAPKSVKITFETFGGTEIEEIAAAPGEEIADRLPSDPERIGYVFGGWYLTDDCTGDRETLPSVMPSSSVTYYAKWTETAATLSLRSNDGGTLSVESVAVPYGTPLLSFLQEYEPTALKAGLSFAGWYRGTEQIKEGDTMPATSLSLTAKYFASYTAEVYLQDGDGSYGEAQTAEGSAFYGEAFDFAQAYAIPAHYEVDEGASGVYRADSLAAGAHFTLYLARESYTVAYYSNLPDGLTTETEMPRGVAYYGTDYTVAACGYSVPKGYRFAGWAESSNGEVRYKAGDTVSVDGFLPLWAVWERGLTDIFSGGDLLFLSSTEEGTVYLDREGFPEQKGTYDAQTKIFSFDTGSTVLDGKLLETQFYYFLDAFENTYGDLDGTDDRITLAAHGVALYVTEGKTVSGRYEFETDTGYFSFLSEEDSFLFNLFEPTDGGAPVFRRQHLEEYGYYYDETREIVLHLDGLGGLEYHFNEQNYEWTMGGQPVLTVYGYYEWSESAGMFIAYTRDFASILEEFTFYLDGDAELGDAPGFENLDIDGVCVLDDRFRGEYSDKWDSTDDLLYLDGFGEGTFGGRAGSYEIITWVYSYEGEDGDVFEDYWLVRFTEESGRIVYLRLDASYGDFELDRVILPEEIEDLPCGRFDFSNLYVLNSEFEGFIFIFENGEAEVWTNYAELNTGDIAYVLYIELISSVVEIQDGVYRFLETVDDYTGNPYYNSFDFTISAGRVNPYYPDAHDTVTFTDGIVLDRTTGKATDHGNPVGYAFTRGSLDFYVFFTENGSRSFVTKDYVKFTEVFSDDVYDIVYPGGAEYNNYDARLLFLNDEVYLGLLYESGLARFVGVGTVEDLGGGEFNFTLTSHISDFTNVDLAEYRNFRFKLIEGGYFAQYHEGLSFPGFTSDGYGRYTYTDEVGATFEGEIVYSIGDILFFLADGGESFIFALTDDEIFDVSDTDAGFWYEMNDNRLISTDKYVVFDGRGNAVFYEYDLLGALTETRATYARTENWSGDFLEYRIEQGGESYCMMLGIYELFDGTAMQTLPLYQKQILHRIGDFDVIGGGHVSSAGYPNEAATYVAADGRTYEGSMYIGTVNTGTASHDFINNAAGDHVRFWVYSDFANNLSTSTEFLFACEEDGLRLLSLPYGDYAREAHGIVTTTELLRLDGLGGAVRLSGNNVVGRGTYTADTAHGGYRYEEGETAFTFRVSSVRDGDVTLYIWTVYTEGEESLFVSEADWTVLRLDGYGTASYTDRYGATRTGESYVISEAQHIGYFGGADAEFLFRYDTENGTFERFDNSRYLSAWYAPDFSSIIFGDATVTVNGENYFYTVSGGNVTLWQRTETGFRRTVMQLPRGNEYSFGGKTYRRWDGSRLTFTDSEFGEAVALSFLPDGAAFTVPATFAGESGFELTVSYTKGAVSAVLTWRDTDAMDSLLESYSVTLRFTGAENTFTVVPLGEYGDYAVEGHANETMTVDGRRVGHYAIGDSLSFRFGFVSDSKGAPLAFTGAYTAISEDPGNVTGYGSLRVLTVTGGDGIAYTVRFYLNDGVCRLESVTVDKTLSVDGVGEVTFRQYWYADGGAYAGLRQYDLIDITMPENGVTTNIYRSTLEEGSKAVLVVQSMNATTGSYTYFAYVLDVVYGEDRFVSGATSEGDLRYGAAQSGDFEVEFLYSAENGEINVRYLLTFSIMISTQEATFENNGNGTWTIHTASRDYLISISRGSGNAVFALDIREI